MNIMTHQKINRALCGEPRELKEGYSRIELLATREMAADESGLIHGGFIFGLADYAAMLAVNHPNVVLGAADSKFLKPVQVHETVIAEAHIEPGEAQKISVNVVVSRQGEAVFKGTFRCFTPGQHVLKKN